MPTRFEPDHAGVAALGRSASMQKGLLALLDRKVKPRAEALTPVLSGRMKTSWRTTSGVRGGTAYGRIYNIARDPRTGFGYPAAVENGTRYMRKQRVLGRALDALRD